MWGSLPPFLPPRQSAPSAPFEHARSYSGRIMPPTEVSDMGTNRSFQIVRALTRVHYPTALLLMWSSPSPIIERPYRKSVLVREVIPQLESNNARVSQRAGALQCRESIRGRHSMTPSPVEALEPIASPLPRNAFSRDRRSHSRDRRSQSQPTPAQSAPAPFATTYSFWPVLILPFSAFYGSDPHRTLYSPDHWTTFDMSGSP